MYVSTLSCQQAEGTQTVIHHQTQMTHMAPALWLRGQLHWLGVLPDVA